MLLSVLLVLITVETVTGRGILNAQCTFYEHKASASAVEYSAKVKAGTGTAQSYANAQRATNSALQEVSIGAGIASKAVKLFSAA